MKILISVENTLNITTTIKSIFEICAAHFTQFTHVDYQRAQQNILEWITIAINLSDSGCTTILTSTAALCCKLATAIQIRKRLDLS